MLHPTLFDQRHKQRTSLLAHRDLAGRIVLDGRSSSVIHIAGHKVFPEEVAAVLPPGGVSFHHRLTVHGSGPNLAAGPRVSFAIHFRTEKSGLRPGTKWQDAGYLNDFNDPVGSPVCYRE